MKKESENIIPELKNDFLPRISCSTGYRRQVSEFKKANKISYSNMVRIAFEKVWGIPKE